MHRLTQAIGKTILPTAALMIVRQLGVTFKWKDYGIKGRERLKTMTLEAASGFMEPEHRLRPLLGLLSRFLLDHQQGLTAGAIALVSFGPYIQRHVVA
jgi:hypothetical protein